MSRGRKPAKVSFGSDWKEIFKSSVGYYLQSIIIELASRSISENGFDSNTKLTLKNSLPKIEESEKPFEIPKSWNWYRLGELCNYGSSSKAEPKNLNDSTWVLDLEDIEKETSVLVAKVRFAERNSLSTKSVFKKGDVLYSKLRPYLDKVIVADEDGVCTTEILPLSFSEEINPNFLMLTLKLRSFLNYVNGVTKGMKMPRLGTKEGKMALIPLPSLTEQNKILNFLADLENNSLKTEGCYFDKEVEQKIVNLQYSQLQGSQISTELNHQLALVKELRQALLSEAMQGKLVPQDERDESAEILLKKIRAEKEKLVAKKRIKRDKPLPPIKPEEIPFEIPSNWTWCRLGILGICQTGTTPSTAEKDNFGDFIPFIKPADISLKGINYHNEGLSEKGLKSGVLVQEDSLLMVCIGGSIGKSYFNEIAVSCNQQINIIKPLSKIGSQFLQYWLQSDYFQDSIWNKASGGTTPIVNRSKWESIFIPLPPLAEQERIFAKLEKLMKFCGELEANIKQGIINADKLMQTALKEVLEPKESVLAA